MIYLSETGEVLSLMKALPEYEPRRKGKCYGSYVPRIIRVTQTPKTIEEIYQALAVPKKDQMLASTIQWMEENGRLDIGPDKQNEATYVCKI